VQAQVVLSSHVPFNPLFPGVVHQAWDAAMCKLDQHYGVLSSPHQWVTHMDEEQQASARARSGCLMECFLRLTCR
jgi:hypothetical protein